MLSVKDYRALAPIQVHMCLLLGITGQCCSSSRAVQDHAMEDESRMDKQILLSLGRNDPTLARRHVFAANDYATLNLETGAHPYGIPSEENVTGIPYGNVGCLQPEKLAKASEEWAKRCWEEYVKDFHRLRHDLKGIGISPDKCKLIFTGLNEKPGIYQEEYAEYRGPSDTRNGELCLMLEQGDTIGLVTILTYVLGTKIEELAQRGEVKEWLRFNPLWRPGHPIRRAKNAGVLCGIAKMGKDGADLEVRMHWNPRSAFGWDIDVNAATKIRSSGQANDTSFIRVLHLIFQWFRLALLSGLDEIGGDESALNKALSESSEGKGLKDIGNKIDKRMNVKLTEGRQEFTIGVSQVLLRRINTR